MSEITFSNNLVFSAPDQGYLWLGRLMKDVRTFCREGSKKVLVQFSVPTIMTLRDFPFRLVRSSRTDTVNATCSILPKTSPTHPYHSPLQQSLHCSVSFW